ncbi:MAG: TA system VapC family ribonuclease toxin [Pyrinomonadaceae bacterium]
MIVPDANLLLYAYNADAAQHGDAKLWLENTFASPDYVGLSWQTITAFIRISTNPRAFPQPLSAREATEITNEWLSQPGVWVLNPTDEHWKILSDLIVRQQITGPLVMDAHLATLATEHGAVLATTDRDFSRFPNLKVDYPLD